MSDQLVAAPASAGRRRSWPLKTLSILVVAPFAAWLGYHLPTSGPLFVTEVVLGALGVIALSYLALNRFEWFIWVVLLTRPIIDITKVAYGPGTEGAETSSGPLATLLGIALIVAVPVWIAEVSRQGSRLPFGAISRALLLLTAASLISCVMSADPVASVLQVARTASAVMVLVALEQLLRTRRNTRRVLVICALSAVFPLIVGLVQLATGGGMLVLGFERITGSFVHPNTFGFFIVMLVLMGYPVRRYLSGPPRWFLDALLIVSLVDLVFTYSRGSWIALAIGLLVVAALAERRLFLALPIVGVAVFLFMPNVVDRLSDLEKPDTLAGDPGNSASWRFDYFGELLAKAGLTLFGKGPKMAERLTPLHLPPHNDAVRMIVENGVVGLVLYLAFLTALVLLAMRALRTLRSGFDRGLAVGFTATVAAFLFDSMGANLIDQVVLLIYILSLAAIVQAWVNTAGAESGAHPSVPVHSGAPTAVR